MDVRIKGIKEWEAHYKKIQARLAGKADGDPLRQAVHKALSRVQKTTRYKLTGGHPLFVRTGRLRASILIDTKRKGKTVSGKVGTNVKYAAIHEFGGTIKPKKGKFLRFPGKDGKAVFVKQVKIPKRPFLHPSFRQELTKIKQDLHTAIRAINGK